MSVPRNSLLAATVALVVATYCFPVDASFASTPTGPKLTKALLPGDATSGSQRVAVNAIGCYSTNSCVAVGSYISAALNAPLALSEVRGHWSTGERIDLPSDATGSASTPSGPVTQLNSISCASAMLCVAVGTYKTNNGYEALLVTKKSGIWGTAQRVKLPANAATSNQLAALFSISCAVPGYCSAVGTYSDALGGQWPLAVTERAGIWGATVAPALPTGALGVDQVAQLSGVDCATADSCVGVGGFVDSTGYEAVGLRQVSGVWGNASSAAVITPPSGAAPLASAEGNALNAVSCATASHCVAVGQFAMSSGYSPAVATWNTGTWSAASDLAPPATPDLSGTNTSTLLSISCVSASECSAVGAYGNVATRLPFITQLSGGTWTPTPGSTALADETTSPWGEYHALDCFSPGTCVTVGDYHSTSGTQGLISTPTTAPAPPSAPILTRANQAIKLSWQAPAYDGTLPITSYVATASPGGESCTTTALGCVITSLHNGQPYTFTVVAINAVGPSSPSASSRPLAPATIPSAPRISSVTALVGGLRLALKAPTSNGGAAISTYQFSVDGGTTWHRRSDGSTSLTLTISGLRRSHTYKVSVRAVNGAGTGAASPIVSSKTK